MRLAIETTRAAVANGQSPFGAVITRGNEIVVATHNVVFATTDITAHAEVNAIRQACAKLKTIDLAGCTIYSTTEPCPMCFSAIHWANIDRIVYGTNIADALAAGFKELTISNFDMKRLGGAKVRIDPDVLRDEAIELFKLFTAKADRRLY